MGSFATSSSEGKIREEYTVISRAVQGSDIYRAAALYYFFHSFVCLFIFPLCHSETEGSSRQESYFVNVHGTTKPKFKSVLLQLGANYALSLLPVRNRLHAALKTQLLAFQSQNLITLIHSHTEWKQFCIITGHENMVTASTPEVTNFPLPLQYFVFYKL